jgi:hypothetical protein
VLQTNQIERLAVSNLNANASSTALNLGLRYLLAPMLMSIVTGVLSAGYQATEASAVQYHVLNEQWEHLSPALKDRIGHAAAGQSVSKWAYTGLIQDILEEARVVTFSPHGDLSFEQEKSQLLKHVAANAQRREVS